MAGAPLLCPFGRLPSVFPQDCSAQTRRWLQSALLLAEGLGALKPVFRVTLDTGRRGRGVTCLWSQHWTGGGHAGVQGYLVYVWKPDTNKTKQLGKGWLGGYCACLLTTRTWVQCPELTSKNWTWWQVLEILGSQRQRPGAPWPASSAYRGGPGCDDYLKDGTLENDTGDCPLASTQTRVFPHK